MKRLSEFEGDAGFELVANLIPYIKEIVQNADNKKSMEGGTVMDFVAALLHNSRHAVKGILALLNEVPIDEYKVTAASLLADTIIMANDPDLMVLFGLQRQTPTSSGSASENTEVQG